MSHRRIHSRRGRARRGGNALLLWGVGCIVVLILLIVMLANRPTFEPTTPREARTTPVAAKAQPSTTAPAPRQAAKKIERVDDRFDRAYLWSSWAVLPPKGRMTGNGYLMIDDGSHESVGILRYVGAGSFDAEIHIEAIAFADNDDLVHEQIVSVGFWDSPHVGFMVNGIHDAAGDSIIVRSMNGDRDPHTHYTKRLDDPLRSLRSRFVWDNSAQTWQVSVGVNGLPADKPIPIGIIRARQPAEVNRTARIVVDQQGTEGATSAAVRRFILKP